WLRSTPAPPPLVVFDRLRRPRHYLRYRTIPSCRNGLPQPVEPELLVALIQTFNHAIGVHDQHVATLEIHDRLGVLRIFKDPQRQSALIQKLLLSVGPQQ